MGGGRFSASIPFAPAAACPARTGQTRNFRGIPRSFHRATFRRAKTASDTAAAYAVIDSTYFEIDGGAGKAPTSEIGLDAKATDKLAASAQKANTGFNKFVNDADEMTADWTHGYTEFSRYAFAIDANENNRDHAKSWTGNEWAYDTVYNTATDAYGRIIYTLAKGTVYRSATAQEDGVGTYYPNDTAVITAGDKNVHVNYDADTKTYAFEYALTSATKFLIHENDGTYTAPTLADLGSLQAAGVQVIDANADGYADVVYLFGGIIRKSDVAVGYVADWTMPQYKVVGSTTYQVYNAYFNGVRTPVYFKDDATMANNYPGVYKFSFSLSEDKILWTEAEAVKTTPHDVVELESLNADKDGMRIVGKEAGLNFASDVKVYWVNGITNAGTKYDLVVEVNLDYLREKTATVAGDSIIYTTNSAGQVTAIYIVTDSNQNAG